MIGLLRRQLLQGLGLLLLLLILPSALAIGSYENTIRTDIFVMRPDSQYIDSTGIPPEFISIEDLYFYGCLPDQDDIPIRLSVYCRENNEFVDLETYQWGEENCFISSFNLEDISCKNLVLQMEYIEDEENRKVSRDIKINKLTTTLDKVLRNQYEDGGWSTPLDTAYGILAMAQYPDVFKWELNSALEWLKLNRREDEKCWPKQRCRVATTAHVLSLLTLAGYDSDLRIMRDGNTYLMDQLDYHGTSDSWNITIWNHPTNDASVFDLECAYSYLPSGSSTETTSEFVVDRTSQYSFLFTAAYDSNIQTVCTENVIVNVSDADGDIFFTYEGNNMSYIIPGVCWQDPRTRQCDYRTTGYALMTEDLETTEEGAVISYVETKLLSGAGLGKYLGSDKDVITSAMFLYYDTSSTLKENVEDWLLYKQTNEGGWLQENLLYYENKSWFDYDDDVEDFHDYILMDQITQGIANTFYVIVALIDESYETTHQVIEDAEQWISKNENEIGFNISDDEMQDEDLYGIFLSNKSAIINDTKRNAMAFYVLKNNARPFLKIQPKLIYMDKQSMELSLVNPTTFNMESLDYEFSNNLGTYLEIEEKEYIAPYSFRRLTLKRKGDEIPYEFGYLKISNLGDEIAKIPVIVTTYPKISITQKESSVTVFGTSKKLGFTIDKSSHTFNCTLDWIEPGISSQRYFTIDSQTTLDIDVTLEKSQTTEKTYTGSFSCRASNQVFNIPVSIKIKQFSSKPIELSPMLVLIENHNEDSSVFVKNRLDEALYVQMSFDVPLDGFEFSPSTFNLFPGEEKNVSILNKVPLDQGMSEGRNIVASTLGIQEQTTFRADIFYEEPKTMGMITLLIFVTVAILILGVGGWFAYTKRKVVLDWYQNKFKKKIGVDKVKRRILELERREQIIAIKNMISLLKMQKIDDDEITKRLLTEGFTKEEISDAKKTKEEDLVDKPPEEKKEKKKSEEEK